MRARLRHYEIVLISTTMKWLFQFALWAMLITCILPSRLAAQLDDSNSGQGNVSLGDLARYLREHKQTQSASAPVIDNDNFSRVMREAERQKSKGIFSFAIDSVKNMFQVSSEDVTCNLSFNANASALLTDSYSPRKMPADELAKLSGPARIDGDNLEVTVNNASNWTIREITVGLTIVHVDAYEDPVANAGMASLLPASVETTEAATDVEKQPDTTVLFHLKGDGAPSSTTIFRQALNAPLAPGEQWHWAIVDAQGTPSASISQAAPEVSAGNAAQPQLSSQATSESSLTLPRQISIPETGPLAFPGRSIPIEKRPVAATNHP